MTPNQPLSKLEDLVAKTADWHGFREEALANLSEDTREFVDSTSWAGELLEAERRKIATTQINQLITNRVISELNRIWKVAVDNDVAGPTKWEIEDRIKALKNGEKEV